jgi:tRNA U34 5-methylaminomethyl-2-thiouridine-forming methyltransferase MnmC
VHLLGDRVPHQDIASRRFEIASGAACLALLAVRRGPFDPATLGAAAASMPDLEHVFPALRPGGRKLFHGRHGWHRSGAFPANVQLLLAGAIVGFLLAPRG